MSQARRLAAASVSDSVEYESEFVPGAVATELEELSVSVVASTTGAVGSEPGAITESVDVAEVMSAGAAALARAAWCLAARWRFFSFSAGPR